MLLGSRIFWAQLVVLVAIAVLHIAALTYELYWYYLWLDVPVHFLGGVWVSLAALWLLAVVDIPRRGIVMVLLVALAIGAAWEVFEVVGGISISEPNYLFDTSLDLLMDVLGALVGYVCARRFFLPRI